MSEALYQKIKNGGTPLVTMAGVRPQYGIKTGRNEAFLIDTPMRDQLVEDEPQFADFIKKYLRGQDMGRWAPKWDGLWIILLKSSVDHDWPWATMEEPDAEECFKVTYPALYARLKPMEKELRARTDQGRFWWELRTCA